MGFELVGQVWDPQGFSDYVKTQNLSWARGVTIHHTYSPNHEQRPKGLTIQHIRNLEDFYARQKGWSAGPHLFTDDDQIFGMSSLERRGVHARSFNATHIGVEVLGNYDSVNPQADERGKECWAIAVATAAILVSNMDGVTVEAINGHRDDPKSSKTCPGKRWDMDQFRADVAEYLKGSDSDRTDDPSEAVTIDFAEVARSLASIKWQLAKIESILPRK